MRKVKGKTRKKAARRTRKNTSLAMRLFFAFVRLLKVPQVPAILVIVGLGYWIYISGEYAAVTHKANQAYSKVFTSSGLVVSDILLEGQHHTPKQDILNAIKDSGENGEELGIGSSIMDVDLWKIKRKLEELTWVKHASVERQYPSTLNVTIIERTPVALWQEQGQVYLIDDVGEVIRTKNLPEYANLILLVGDDAPPQVMSLLATLEKQPELAGMVSSAIRVGKRRWNIRLKNGTEIKLPEENYEKAWAYLAQIHHDTHIIDSNVKNIDLRVEEKMFVK